MKKWPFYSIFWIKVFFFPSFHTVNKRIQSWWFFETEVTSFTRTTVGFIMCLSQHQVLFDKHAEMFKHKLFKSNVWCNITDRSLRRNTRQSASNCPTNIPRSVQIYEGVETLLKMSEGDCKHLLSVTLWTDQSDFFCCQLNEFGKQQGFLLVIDESCCPVRIRENLLVPFCALMTKWHCSRHC